MSRSEKKRRNVLAVIEMFANVGLPVCDDEQAIKAKRDEQRAARNRELNSTKGTVAARAQQWFDDVDALLNRREKLLQVVFEEFCGLADTALRAGLDGGRNTLGADTQIALRDLAMSWCRARSDLANKWLEQFQERRGLAKGGAVEPAQLVENLRASARGGRVQLRWERPEEGCDGVQVVRAPDPPGDPGEELLVYEGDANAFLDTEVQPKAHYVYRVYSVSGGRRSLRSAQVGTRPTGRKRRLAIPLAAALLVGLAGVAGWDLARDGSWLRALRAAQPATAAAGATSAARPAGGVLDGGVDAPSRVPAPATDMDAIARAQQLAERVAAGEHEDLAAAEPRADAAPAEPAVEPEPAAEPPPSDLAPPTATIQDAPTLAFSGQTLLIELSIDRPLRPTLVEPVLQGVRLRGLDLDRSPGVVRLYVDELPEGELEGEAFWSFRLADAHGLETGTLAGRTLVLRPKTD